MNKIIKNYAGQHYIIDFWGAHFLQDLQVIEQALIDAAQIAETQLLHLHLHQFSQYGGITGVALLAESHISVHTWPENQYAAFDIFMCGNAQPEKALSLLKQVFQPHKITIQEILRGQY
jgi:S-adenosylmethionine decarboxylase